MRARTVVLSLAVCRSPLTIPYHIVVLVVVYGHVVVHGVAGSADPHTTEGARVEDVHEGRSLRWRSHRASEQLLGCVAGTIHLFVGIAALDDGGSLEGDAGEETLGLGITEDTGEAPQGRGTGSLGVATDGTSGQGDITTQSQRSSLSKRLDSLGVVEDKDKIGQLEADLTADAGTAGRDSTRSAPGAIGKPSDDKTATEATGADEAGLEDGEDSETLSVGEDRRRNDLVGTKGLARVDEGGEDLAALFAFRWRELGG